MARKSTKTAEAETPAAADEGREAAPRGRSVAIWKGSISFGLVNIPVALHSAEARDEITFHLLDRRNLAPVRYKRVNEATGAEVPWNQIVKGYEHEPGQYVVMGEEDFKRANVEASQTVEIVAFVDEEEITPLYYDKPYYLQPDKKARKSYALLREVLQRSGKVGIARIVLRSRQYIAAVYPLGRVLVVDLLRYEHELRDANALDLPGESVRENGISEGEIKMAARLVDAMVDKWEPGNYRDEYRDDLLGLINRKIESGKTETVEPAPKRARSPKVVDIMDLLRQSVARADKAEARTRRKPEPRRKAG